MNIEIRIYKRYDTDLLSLHDAGYSITKMMQEAVSSYANGLPCHFFIDEMLPFDMNDKKSVRLRLKFKDNDFNTVNLIRNIKHGYRSNFCKQLLRNAFVQQNVLCYMSNSSTFQMHDINAKFLNLQAFPNLKMCSEYRREMHKLNILGKEVVIKHEKGYKYRPNQNTFDPQPQQIPIPQQGMPMQGYLQSMPVQNMQSMLGYAQMPMQGQYTNAGMTMPNMVGYGQYQQIPTQGQLSQPVQPAPQPQAQQFVEPSVINTTVPQPQTQKTPSSFPQKKELEPTFTAPDTEADVTEVNGEDTTVPQIADNANLMALFDGLG